MNREILKSMDIQRIPVERLISLLQTFALKHAAKALPDLLESADLQPVSHRQFLLSVLETEVKGRNERRRKRNYSAAHFPPSIRPLEEFNPEELDSGITQAQLDKLKELSWLDNGGNLLFADAAISVSSDALELLKSSSLFQKIGDKDLSMKIIRAYDTCGAIASSMNRHLEDRNNRFDKAINNETAKQLITGSNINIRKFISSPYGAYSVQWVANQPDPSQYVDISDINAAIEAINSHTH